MWFLYELLVTRWPPPPGWPSGRAGAVDLSATSAPSSTRQLAVPTWSQPFMVLPSNSWAQPGPVWPAAGGATWRAAKPAMMSPEARAKARVEVICMVVSSLDVDISLYADD